MTSTVCRASLLALTLFAAACSNNPVQPTALASTDLIVGSGATAVAGRTITVHYTGWLFEDGKPDQKGAQFDSSVGGTPYGFVLGTGRVIAGWDQGVPGMRVGGRRRLVIPPALGYGSQGAGSAIPPNRALVFDIELISVQ
jgi:FKBP-type peptidyl-prolyl cis-trans isomerase FkpA